MPPSLFPLIHSPCIWKISQHGDKYVNLSYIELTILEFLKKKEREEKIQSRSALEGWSRFFDFAINYRICERSARVPIWNRVKLRIVRTTWPLFSLLSFLLPFYRNLLCRMSRDFVSTVSRDSIWALVKVQISRWRRRAAWSFLLSRCANCKQCPPRKSCA